jgi:peptidoglycan/LPS O-acetylase OafA/YrhL
MGWLIYFCPFVRLFEFVAGALAAKLYLTLGTRARMPLSARIVFVAALAWCVAAIFVAPVSENRAFGFLGPNFLFAPALAPILVLCCTYETPLSRMLSSRPALFAGEISYSVYIWSFAILTLISIGSSPAVGSLASLSNSGLRLAAVVFLTTALAYGSYLLVEMPSRRAIRAMLSGRPRVRQQARSLATSERTAVHPS